LRKSEVSDLSAKKVQAAAARIAWKRHYLAKLRPTKSSAIPAPASKIAPIFATEFCTD
jgi:hypothetical protein